MNFSKSLRRLVLISGLLASSQSYAWFKICNNSTAQSVSTAIAYSKDGGWASQGWWTIPNGQCKTVVGGGRLGNRYYYVHGYAGSRVWGGNHKFCTVPFAFTLGNAQQCTDGTMKSFAQVDTGNFDNFTYNLN